MYALLRIQVHYGLLCWDKVVPQMGAKVMAEGSNGIP